MHNPIAREKFLPAAAAVLVAAVLIPARGVSAASAPADTGAALLQPLPSLPPELQGELRPSLSALGVEPQHAFVDPGSGRWGTLLLSRPLIPPPTGSAQGPEGSRMKGRVWTALMEFLHRHREALGVDPEELGAAGDIAVHGRGEVFQIHAPRQVGGLPVEGSYLTAVVSHGNLVLLGFRRWADVEVSLDPSISPLQVLDAVDGAAIGSIDRRPQLVVIPEPFGGAGGPGYRHRLAWRLLTDEGWEIRVDAHEARLLSREHRSRSAGAASVVGGVYPTSNDGLGPEGTEQPQWPMPFARVRDLATGEFVTADHGGNLPACLDGPFEVTNLHHLQVTAVSGFDCGSHSETLPGPLIDLGTGTGTDCAKPPGRADGSTHAQRTGFYELNRIRESASAQLPDAPWFRDRSGDLLISRQLHLEPNRPPLGLCDEGFGCCYLQDTPEIIFCEKSAATRANPGELASILDHEFGHVLDDNDLTVSLSNPSEGIADAVSALRQNQTCIGRGLFATPCGGYGDPCTDCTGIRDVDWEAHASGLPHDIAFIDAACAASAQENGPCGGSAHCEGMVVAEALWDLYRRDLQSPPYNALPATALELATRLTYLSAYAVGDWFQCSDGTATGDGCNADGGYLNLLAVDDDNGNLADGTPHMTAIFNAFDRHGIACPVPAVQDSGCAGTPTLRPVVQATPLDRSTRLSWTSVPGASSYEVFRTEGVAQCAFGKTKVAEVEGTGYFDTGLANGREYSYVVIPKGPGLSCFGANSVCTSVTPAAGARVELVAGTEDLVLETGDGDRFVDNCETAVASFDLLNSGMGDLTNLRIVAASSPSHPQLEGLSALPRPVAPSLTPCASAEASFSFRSRGMAHDDTLEMIFELTSDELSPATMPVTLRFRHAESDFDSRASHTFSFETDLEGWRSREGEFRRVAGAGGNGTSAFVEALPFGRQRCDQLRSPLLRLTAASALDLWNNFDIMPPNDFDGIIFEAANLRLIRESAIPLVPDQADGGREYFEFGDIGPEERYWKCNDYMNGWAGTADSWGPSAFSAAALESATVAGEAVQLEVLYGQTRLNEKRGFAFDELTLTDFELQVPDQQGNQLCPGPVFADGFESGDTSSWSGALP